MQVKLYGKTELVTSAVVLMSKIGLEILINTRDKMADYHRPGICMQYNQEEFAKGNYRAEHDCIDIYAETDDIDNPEICHVVVIPETDEDRHSLSEFAYYSQNKDQIACLKIDRKFLMGTNLIAEVNSGEIVAKQKLAP